MATRGEIIMQSAMPTVVLVHGAWNGPWAWDEVRRYLDLAQITSATVALPSVGEDTGKLGGLADDVAAVAAVLDRLSGPFVLVGHSYSALPVTEIAAAREDVTHVVYTCAIVIPPGNSLLDAVGGQLPEWWILDEDSQSIMPDNPGTLLFAECPLGVANAAIARLRPHSARAVREPLRAAGYGAKPATYVICERDAALQVDMAKAMAALAQAATVSLDADHHPMLSRPAELALILAGIVARTTHDAAVDTVLRPDKN
jgi:pimeloyl-ACP methyl ester carboxylesterase